MSENRYVITTVGEFYDVFDTVDKITVFVTEDENKARGCTKVLNKGFNIPESINQVGEQ